MSLVPALQACPPRPELGRAEDYAAHLDQALKNEIASESGAADFFAATYPTQAMRDACRMIFDRLRNGAAGGQPSVYRFTSVYGGGKTHTLIALAAAARYPDLIRRGGAARGLLPADLAVDGVRIISFNGRNSDAVNGALLDDSGARAKSLVGFIAYHLGGASALSEIREYDDQLANPGSAWHARLFSDRPTLILVDELIYHVANAIGHVANPANIHLTIASIADAIAASPRTALVITSPERSHDAFRQDMAVQAVMDSVASELARVSHEMTPSSGDDLAAILRRRVFSDCDEDARRETSRAYARIARRADPSDQDAEDRFHAAYPFHPALLDAIRNRLFANEDFQRARGAIRMMVNIATGGKLGDAPLIHPHHADMSISRLNDQLIARLRHEDLAPAITADVIGADSVAGRVGTELAFRVANTILLASLAPENVRGIDENAAASAIASPEYPDHPAIKAAFAQYSQRALFLDETRSSRGERFTSQPNVRRMVSERRTLFGVNQIEDALKDAVRAEYDQSAQGLVKNPIPVTMYPSRLSNAPDLRDAARLCIIAPGYFNWRDREGNESAIGDLHRQKSGASDTHREHRNNVIFLVAQDDDLADVRDHLATHMAATEVKRERGGALLSHQREILDEIIAAEKKALSQSIQRKWTSLIYPRDRNDLGDAAPHLAHETLTAATDSEGNGQEPIIKKLIERLKIPHPDRPRLNPSAWAATALGRPEFESEGRTVAEVHRAFTASPARMMMLNRDAFRDVLTQAIVAGDLYIESPAGQAITAENADIGVEDDFRVWISGKEPRCPDCRTRWEGPPCANCVPEPTPAALCPDCRRPMDGETCPNCAGVPDAALPIPPFRSEPMPASIAAAALGNHMASRKAGKEDVAALTVMSAKPDALTYIADKMGAALAAKASFRIDVVSADDSVSLRLRGQSADDWKTREAIISRIIGIAGDNPLVDCNMEFSRAADCSPADFAAIVNSFDNRREVAIGATFARQTENG